MTSPILWRIVWKEYRGLRAFWLAVVAASFFIQLVVAASAPTTAGRAGGVVFVAYMAALVMLAGSSAVVFAREREEETRAFLAFLPAAEWHVALGKLLWILGSAAAALAALMATALVLGGDPARVSDAGGGSVTLIFPAVAMNMLAWGIFFSVVCRQALFAAGAALVVSLIAPLPVQIVLEMWLPLGFKTSPYAYAIASVVMALILLPLDVWLATRWLRGTGARLEAVGGRDARAAFGLGAIVHRLLAAVGVSGWSRDEVAWRVALARLVWHGVRQSAVAWAALVVAWSVLLLVLAVAPFHEPWNAAGLAALAALAAGMLAFGGDQSRQRYRFFAEHHVSPRQVWLSRQLVALPLAVAPMLAVALLLVARGVEIMANNWNGFSLAAFDLTNLLSFATPEAPGEMLAAAAVLALCAYAAGQWWSMLVRTQIVAAPLAVITATALILWAGVMSECGINWLWAVAPLPIALLVSTWLRAPAWILERRGLAWLVAPAAVVAVPCAAILVGAAVYRVASIPLVAIDRDVSKYLEPASAESAETARMYVRAWERIVRPAEPVPANIVEYQRRDVRKLPWDFEANREALALFMEASAREECDTLDFARNSQQSSRVLNGLSDLVLSRAYSLTQAGDLDAAWQHYRALLATAAQLRARTVDEYLPDGIERRVLGDLPQWAAQREQTAERIAAVAAELDAYWAAQPPIADVILCEYAWLRAAIAGERSADELMLKYDERKAIEAADLSVALRLMPWERLRSQRVLDQLTARNLIDVDVAERLVADDKLHAAGILLPPRLTYYLDWRTHGAELRRHPFGAPARERIYGVGLASDPRTAAGWRRTETYWIWWNAHALSPRDVHSTWFIAAGLTERGQAAAADLAAREQLRRATRLVLAIEAWRAEHGALPESLDQVVGVYIDAVPRDPYTGIPLEYIRGDRPVDLSQPIEGAAIEWEALPPQGATYIWAAGPYVELQLTQDGQPGNRYLVYQILFQYAHSVSSETSHEVFHAGARYLVPEGEEEEKEEEER